MIEQATKAVSDFFPGHTNYQIRQFMVGQAGTDYGMWRQCQREILSRLDGVKKDDPRCTHEMAELLRLEAEYRERLGELTPERIEELERQDWYWKVRRELALDYYVLGQPQRSTLETILLLPEDDRMKLLGLVREYRGKMPPVLTSWVEQGALPEVV